MYYGIEIGEWLFAMKERHCSACIHAEKGRCTNGEKFLDLECDPRCITNDKKFKAINLETFIKRRRKNG